MSNYTVSAYDLTEGRIVIVRGKLAYSRLTRLIDGAELERVNARKVAKGMLAVSAPHTSVTITNAEMVLGDENNPTLEERFVAERRYASNAHPGTGANYSLDSKSKYLPVIAVLNESGQAVQITPEGELDAGLDVTLILRVFKTPNYSNRGLRLDRVIVNEPIRYYRSATDEELAKRGLVFAVPPRPVEATATASSTSAEAAPTPPVPPVPVAPAPVLPAPIVNAPVAAAPAPVVSAAPEPGPLHAPVPVPPEGQGTPAPSGATSLGETVEERLARLEAENATLKGQAHAQTGSAFDPTLDPADPWASAAEAPDPMDPWASNPATPDAINHPA